MRTVYKYKLISNTTLKLPIGAKPLCVSFQGEDLCIWCDVNTKAKNEERTFRVFGTGHEIPQDMGINPQYIGTAFIRELVFHVYEIK
jgi:hypothetical protein